MNKSLIDKSLAGKDLVPPNPKKKEAKAPAPAPASAVPKETTAPTAASAVPLADGTLLLYPSPTNGEENLKCSLTALLCGVKIAIAEVTEGNLTIDTMSTRHTGDCMVGCTVYSV